MNDCIVYEQLETYVGKMMTFERGKQTEVESQVSHLGTDSVFQIPKLDAVIFAQS